MFSFTFVNLFFRLFFVTPFLVEGPSMLPTLTDGEFFFLDTYAYRAEAPERGDIVVFTDDKKKDYFYVKRVVGLPGERIHVTPDAIYLERSGGTKEKLTESYLAHAEDTKDLVSRYKDEIFAVPDDKYFVLGDNRRHSFDSRYFVHPFVSTERMKGKYLFTFFKP